MNANLVNGETRLPNPLGLNPLGNNLVLRVENINIPRPNRINNRYRNLEGNQNRNGRNRHRNRRNGIRNDTQNVHDSTVIRTICNSINKLKNHCKIK